MSNYNSAYTGAQIDAAVARALLAQLAPASAAALPTSGVALSDNTGYTVPSTSPVGTYQFVAPTGHAWGTFYTDATVAITFETGAKYAPEAPSFDVSSQYEFDVEGGVWIFAKVVSA